MIPKSIVSPSLLQAHKDEFVSIVMTEQPDKTLSMREGTPSERRLESPTWKQKMGYRLTRPWKTILPASWLRQILSRSQSPLLREAFIRPGGWRSMQIIYENASPCDWLDAQALRDNPISMASRNRKQITIAKLTELIQSHAQRSERLTDLDEPRVIALGIGAGPGQHLQQALLNSGLPKDDVKLYLIDRDADAFSYGQSLAEEAGISESVEFRQGNALHISTLLPEVSPDIVKLIGLIEYLTDDQLTNLLKAISAIMKPGASLLTHAFIDRYRGGAFLRRVFHLEHQYRTAQHVAEILQSCNFCVREIVSEPTETYPLILASTPS